VNLHDVVLLAELRRKHPESDTKGFHTLDYVAAFGSPEDALMYVALFWPELVEFEGMILRRELLEDAEDVERIHCGLSGFAGSLSRTELAFNTIEVPGMIFSRSASFSSEEIDAMLAGAIAELWRCRLQVAYPDYRFCVVLTPPGSSAEEHSVGFYRIREGDVVDQ
jgi:hypothetical protein